MAAGANERLYGRKARVILAIPVSTPGDYQHVTTDTIEINDSSAAPGLRIKFKIVKTDEKDPNSSEITIVNLEPAHRAALQQKGVKATLEAGYEATGLTRIFFGDIRTTDHVRNGSSWDTVLKCGDGERSFQYARLTESFAPGTGAGDIVKRLAQASGLAIGNVPDQVLNIQLSYDHGYCVAGLVSKSLDKLLKGLGYTYSIQDGALQVLTPNSTIGGEVPVLSPSTGLIGSPEMGSPEKKGKPALLKFKAYLFPARPRGRVKIESDRYNGFFRVKKATLSGDTRGPEWYTEGEGVNVGQEA